MLISYNWLKEYLNKLPKPEKLVETLNLKSFEIEGLEKVGNDWVIDADVLPNRSSDCLCHRGFAKEISAITKSRFKDKDFSVVKTLGKGKVGIDIKTDFCERYIAKQINNIRVEESPKEIKQKLEALGQKTINNVVDITNIVLFDLGQPMHAFDFDKLSNDKKIIVRPVNNKESIVTLDNKDVELNQEDYLIADSEGPLSIAGVKGGKRAETNENTKNIVLEAAHFMPVQVRKTSKRIGIVTESSRRFENEITPEMVSKAMNLTTKLILKYASTDKTEVYDSVEYYPKPERQQKTGVSVDETNKILGLKLSEGRIKKIFKKLDFEFEIVNPREKIVSDAKNLVGKKYKYGASVLYDSPEMFDCSSLTSYLYAQSGIPLPRISIDQFVAGDEITEEELQPGDLVFSNDGGNGNIRTESVEYLPGTSVGGGIDHVGLYIGDGQVIHASSKNGDGVEIGKIFESNAFKHNLKYARLIKDRKRFVVTVPFERLDLSNRLGMINHDLIEEIGRINGYNKIKGEPITENSFEPKINKSFALNNVIRKTLTDLGFSEVSTYSFVKDGKIQPEKPLSEDRPYLRSTLILGMDQSLEFNLHYADLLGLNQIKVFEIGKVFDPENPDAGAGEKLMLSVGVVNKTGFKKPKASDVIKESLEKLSKSIGVDFEVKVEDNTNSVEIELETLYSQAPDAKEYTRMASLSDKLYKPISQYPFVLRDIAVWIPKEVDSIELETLIKKESGDLLVNMTQFDVYEKDGKTSYAYRLVFQSDEKTLTDAEINPIMDSVNEKLKQKGWEVR